MAFSDGFFNSKGKDRQYTAENFNDYLSSIICNGILDTYGDNFELTAPATGLRVVLGRGKAWINGHYFVNDARYSIDLSEYLDESLPRYVSIGIVCDISESVRKVQLEIVPGTPAENPSVPPIPTDGDRTRLLLYAVRLNVGATSLSDSDWFDYRNDDNLCGYCKCILGKCKVTEMQSQIAQIIAEMSEYNDTIAELTNKVDVLQTKVDDLTGDVVEAGQCGDDIYYVIYSNGKVLLRGTGEMYDYDTSIPISDCHYPDVNGDGQVNASDASLILTAAANLGAGNESGLTPEQELLADANSDGSINARDASLVQMYAAQCGAGNYSDSLEGWIEFLNDQRAGDNISPFFDNQDIKSVVVSDGITSLGTFAFNYCNNLTSASLPNSLTKIGSNAFAPYTTDTYGLTAITIPSGVTEIGQYAFAYTQLTSLTIPRSVTTVGDCVCYECTNLATVRYEGAVIGAYMFMGCTALTNFTIAITCTEISSRCFNYCPNLTTITYEGSLADWALVIKGTNWDSHSGSTTTNLTKIQCLDGYMEWDSENGEWTEVKENA